MIIPTQSEELPGGMGRYEARVMGWFGPNMGDYTTDLIRQLSDIVIQ